MTISSQQILLNQQFDSQRRKFYLFGHMSSPKKNKLNRFTTLPVLLDMLIRNRLVFSDPKFWDDKNDSEILEIYKSKKYRGKADARIFALCFLKDHETVHHWKAFANGISGCCIEFDKNKLVELFSKCEGVRFGSVIYKRLKDLGDGSADECVPMIPFMKRWPYRFEKEFRAIWDGDTGKNNYEIPINDYNNIITQITLSPNLKESDQLFITIREFLNERFRIPTCKVNPSTVYENREGWIEKFKMFKNTD